MVAADPPLNPGLGGVPFFFVGKLDGRSSGIANSLACGVMLSASFNLIYEGQCARLHAFWGTG